MKLTLRRVALDAAIVAMLALAGWLAVTGMTERTLVPTYNHEPGVVVPERQAPTIPSQPTHSPAATKEPTYV